MDGFQIKRQLFDQTIGFLHRSLSLRTFRHRVLSDNIANAETPNYIAKEIHFRKILEEAMQDRSPVLIRTTHSRHLSGGDPGAISPESSDQGVFLDQEMARLAENNLMFQAGIQALMSKFEGLKTVIQEGGR